MQFFCFIFFFYDALYMPFLFYDLCAFGAGTNAKCNRSNEGVQGIWHSEFGESYVPLLFHSISLISCKYPFLTVHRFFIVVSHSYQAWLLISLKKFVLMTCIRGCVSWTRVSDETIFCIGNNSVTLKTSSFSSFLKETDVIFWTLNYEI